MFITLQHLTTESTFFSFSKSFLLSLSSFLLLEGDESTDFLCAEKKNIETQIQ